MGITWSVRFAPARVRVYFEDHAMMAAVDSLYCTATKNLSGARLVRV